MSRRYRYFLACALASWTHAARATDMTDVGMNPAPSEKFDVRLNGYFRTRAEALTNLDLDRGPTPSGQVLFPVSAGDPQAQTLLHADMRLRTDLAVYVPSTTLSVNVRADWLDNVALGSFAPDGPNLNRAVVLKRAYGVAVTPVGFILAGRVGAPWGLGMKYNSGDCLDCDGGDVADRFAFVMPLAEHLVAVTFDWAGAGAPIVPRRQGGRTVTPEPALDTHVLNFAVQQIRSDMARARRTQAGRSTLEYGALGFYAWKNKDAATNGARTSQPVPFSGAQVIDRKFRSGTVSAWGRLTFPWGRIGAEAMYVIGSIDQATTLPGFLLRQPITLRQYGGVLESLFGPPSGLFGFGIDAGIASGDPAPGFGVNTPVPAALPQAGDLDGAQVDYPRDRTIENFTFSPDYRVDRILFREIIGTVTDAMYARPHLRYRLLDWSSGSLTAQVATIASMAMSKASTPGGSQMLGVEVDPTLSYESRDGFRAALEHATLFPMGGLDNPPLGLSAKPAQLLRLRLAFVF